MNDHNIEKLDGSVFRKAADFEQVRRNRDCLVLPIETKLTKFVLYYPENIEVLNDEYQQITINLLESLNHLNQMVESHTPNPDYNVQLSFIKISDKLIQLTYVDKHQNGSFEADFVIDKNSSYVFEDWG